MTTPYTCPECGGKIEMDDHAQVETTVWTPPLGLLERRLRPAIVAACTACEFAIEIRPLSAKEMN